MKRILMLLMMVVAGVSSEACDSFVNYMICDPASSDLITEILNVENEDSCQMECRGDADCTHFSWIRYSADGSSFTICMLWKGCNKIADCSSTCQYSITGPREPRYPFVCCSRFSEESSVCSSGGGNMLSEVAGTPDLLTCQELCQDRSLYAGCSYFMYNAAQSLCTLLTSCDSKMDCESCASGPAFPSATSCSKVSTLKPSTSTERITTEGGPREGAVLLAGKMDLASHRTEVETWSCSHVNSTLPNIPMEIINRPGAAYLNGVLYLCGGYDTKHHTTSSECIVLGQGEKQWGQGRSMKLKRDWFTLNVVGDVLVAAGGQGGSAPSHVSIEIFRNGAWELSPHVLSSSRRNHCAVTISESEIVFLGGYEFVPEAYLDLVEKLNIQTGEWTTLPRMPFAVRGLACALQGDEILVSGGYNGTDYSAAVYALNLGSLAWRNLPSLNYLHYDHTMEVVNGLPVVLGAGLVGTVEVLRGDTWQVEHLRYSRSKHASAVVPCSMIQ